VLVAHINQPGRRMRPCKEPRPRVVGRSARAATTFLPSLHSRRDVAAMVSRHLHDDPDRRAERHAPHDIAHPRHSAAAVDRVPCKYGNRSDTSGDPADLRPGGGLGQPFPSLAAAPPKYPARYYWWAGAPPHRSGLPTNAAPNALAPHEDREVARLVTYCHPSGHLLLGFVHLLLPGRHLPPPLQAGRSAHETPGRWHGIRPTFPSGNICLAEATPRRDRHPTPSADRKTPAGGTTTSGPTPSTPPRPTHAPPQRPMTSPRRPSPPNDTGSGSTRAGGRRRGGPSQPQAQLASSAAPTLPPACATGSTRPVAGPPSMWPQLSPRAPITTEPTYPSDRSTISTPSTRDPGGLARPHQTPCPTATSTRPRGASQGEAPAVSAHSPWIGSGSGCGGGRRGSRAWRQVGLTWSRRRTEAWWLGRAAGGRAVLSDLGHVGSQ